MKVQRIQLGSPGRITWLVLGDNYVPIEPICVFLKYLGHAERSPNTIRSYAYHLMLFWIYLRDAKLDWTQIKITHLAAFISWLRSPPPAPRVVTIYEAETPARRETTANAILAAVTAFYQYHERLGTVPHLAIYSHSQHPFHSTRYKPFLHHISKGKPKNKNSLKLTVSKHVPKTLTAEEVGKLISACENKRDRFLVSLLYETGMRIGQALGLRHEDIKSYDNVVMIVPRDDNVNGARAKTYDSYAIHVSKELMILYADYLIDEYGDIGSDYVLINLWEEPIGRPMTYSAVIDLFKRLSKKTKIYARPHILRHTHATELLLDGWDEGHVQKRLGHKSVQTTINIYTHIRPGDLKKVHQDYLARRKDKS